MNPKVLVRCVAVEATTEVAILVFIDSVEDGDKNLNKLDGQVLWFPLSQIEPRTQVLEGEPLEFFAPRWFLERKVEEISPWLCPDPKEGSP